jgi:hypothetical protein
MDLKVRTQERGECGCENEITEIITSAAGVNTRLCGEPAAILRPPGSPLAPLALYFGGLAFDLSIKL